MRGIATLAVAAVALTGCAASTGTYDRYDNDADTCLTRDEIRNIAFLDRFDGDADGAVSFAEFGTGWRSYGVFDRWDADMDGYVTGAELGTGSDLGAYRVWDENESGRLDEGEVAAGVFASWDIDDDDDLSAEELYDGVFDTWDVNRDECWDVDEYGEGVGVDFAG